MKVGWRFCKISFFKLIGCSLFMFLFKFIVFSILFNWICCNVYFVFIGYCLKINEVK